MGGSNIEVSPDFERSVCYSFDICCGESLKKENTTNLLYLTYQFILFAPFSLPQRDCFIEKVSEQIWRIEFIVY